MQTYEFVKILLDRVEKKRDPYLTIGAMDQTTCELVCAVHNLDLAIWQPATRQIYVRTLACERYLTAKGLI